MTGLDFIARSYSEFLRKMQDNQLYLFWHYISLKTRLYNDPIRYFFQQYLSCIWLSILLCRSCYLLKHSQIRRSLANSYMSTLECSSTFLTLHEKFLSLSALFATNAVSRTSVQLHQLLTSRESLMLSREALHFGKHKILRTHWAVPGGSEKTPLTL